MTVRSLSGYTLADCSSTCLYDFVPASCLPAYDVLSEEDLANLAMLLQFLLGPGPWICKRAFPLPRKTIHSASN